MSNLSKEERQTTKLLKIAVLDSGFTRSELSKDLPLCKTGHKDFTTTGLGDNHGHGTHITNIIYNRIRGLQYCFIIIKWYDPNTPHYFIQNSSYRAFEYLNSIDVDVINYSGGGIGSDIREKKEIWKLLRKSVKVFVAAGNESDDLDKKCNYYPACYHLHGLRVVGNLDTNGTRWKSSNYGKVVTDWRIGVDIAADMGKGYERYLSGTSQACAIATAKEINRMVK